MAENTSSQRFFSQCPGCHAVNMIQNALALQFVQARFDRLGMAASKPFVHVPFVIFDLNPLERGLPDRGAQL